MPQVVSKPSKDVFGGLRLPVNIWKALEDAHITTLEQLRAVAPLIEQIPSIGPDKARVINAGLDRLATRRVVRVRLVITQHPHRTK